MQGGRQRPHDDRPPATGGNLADMTSQGPAGDDLDRLTGGAGLRSRVGR
jgi:hypothetical protein